MVSLSGTQYSFLIPEIKDRILTDFHTGHDSTLKKSKCVYILRFLLQESRPYLLDIEHKETAAAAQIGLSKAS